MLKKLVFFMLAVVIIPTLSDAQVVNVGKKQLKSSAYLSEKEMLKEEVKENVTPKNVTEENALTEGEEAVEEEAPPPANVTAEERIEIETESKKNIRKNLKKQDTKEREISLGLMNWAEKELKMRELMAGGMSYKDAKNTVEESVKVPKINVKKDKDIEKYIYKKGAFIADEQ